jgi:hypothetical protein
MPYHVRAEELLARWREAERRHASTTPGTKLLTCLDADSTRATRALGCEVGDRLAPTLLARPPGVARS